MICFVLFFLLYVFVFLFKQKTAYEMRISDWSSDGALPISQRALADGEVRIANRWLSVDPYMRGRMNDVKSYVPPYALGEPMQGGAEIGRASCRERVCQYV